MQKKTDRQKTVDNDKSGRWIKSVGTKLLVTKRWIDKIGGDQISSDKNSG